MDEETKSAMESGKPVMIFHINSVGQMNPSATTVTNHYWGDEFVPVEDADGNITGAARRNATKAKGKSDPKAPKPVQKPALPKLTKKPKADKPRELMTFTKRGILKENLKLLYQQMIAFKWITKDTQEDDFIALFSGELSECKIYWDSKTYGKSTLVYFFQQLMMVEELITLPKGYTIPNVLMGHFVDENDEFLTNLDKGDAPNDKAGAEIIEFIKTLKLNANRAGRRSKRTDYQDEEFSGYGDELSSHLEDEGLSYSSKPY